MSRNSEFFFMFYSAIIGIKKLTFFEDMITDRTISMGHISVEKRRG